jgi:predicted nucleotidyltransferase component of viral defense system
MKKINPAQVDLIDALVAEYDIGGLSAAILEKDIHVTDALSAMMQIKHPKINLIFCGGTSLSKAFGVIERMSEDIDIKIDIKPLAYLTTSARKTYLSNYKEKIKSTLTHLGFVENAKMADANNANHLFSMEWQYQSEYQSESSLRPHLRIEVKTCEIACPTEQKEIGYLAEKLAGIDKSVILTPCQAIEETLAEKVISFLRRYDRAIYLGEKWDSALIRHFYDVFCITSNNTEIVKKSQSCFPALIASDVKEYGNQHSSFKLDPFKTLLISLNKAEIDPTLASYYQEKLIPLVLGDIKPSFTEVRTRFSETARALLSH